MRERRQLDNGAHVLPGASPGRHRWWGTQRNNGRVAPMAPMHRLDLLAKPTLER
jgi:hypothetical protein